MPISIGPCGARRGGAPRGGPGVAPEGSLGVAAADKLLGVVGRMPASREIPPEGVSFTRPATRLLMGVPASGLAVVASETLSPAVGGTC